MVFDYQEAFSRNIGWLTETEQELLRTKRIAIAGLGGVGGSHLLTLTRLGIGAFNISDLDIFELANFNRQAGASLSHIDKPKVEVLASLALDINPDLKLIQFGAGIDTSNVDDFLEGVDLYVDALDFFAFEARKTVFAACYDKGIPAITAAPIGMGTALLYFKPGKMSFEQYFRLEGQSDEEQALRLLLGLSPSMLQMPYLADDSRVDFKAQKAPSTPMACELCAGFAGTWALKSLLGRGQIPAAPRGIHFDAYRNKLSTTWRPGGNLNPIQQLGLMIARRRVMAKPSNKNEAASQTPVSLVERIIDLALWAPSGDNEQPWRFEIVDDSHFVIFAHDTSDWCVYDLDGRASQIAVGALLETISIAATNESYSATFTRRLDSEDSRPIIDVRLNKSEGLAVSHLYPFIKLRMTQRRPLNTVALTPEQKQVLEAAVGDQYKIIWLETSKIKGRMARLLFSSAHIRLTIPEAYEVHKQNIEWGAQYSENKIPDKAVGVDALTLKIMRWTLESWNRVKMMNRYFAGTVLPRLQMDLLPGYRCAAHFVIVSHQPLKDIDDYLAGGRAVQRFWLSATAQGLQFQPEMTPLIFSRYSHDGVKFTDTPPARARADKIAGELEEQFGDSATSANRVFMGRIGLGDEPKSRSVRRPIGELIKTPKL